MDLLSSRCAEQSVGPANNLLGTFITTIIALHCNISSTNRWPKDYGRKALRDGFGDYDYVIIGAGTAGSVVAGRLAENPYNKILLIEAGGNPPIESEIIGLSSSYVNTKFNWNYPTQSDKRSCLGRKNEMCSWNLGKALGGSQSFDAAFYERGNNGDYDDWLEKGNVGWDAQNIEPYFRKTERFRGGRNRDSLHGTLGTWNVEKFRIPRKEEAIISRITKELNFKKVDDFIAGNYLGFGRVFGNLRRGRRMTTAKAFLTRKRSNLDVIKHAVATKIIFDNDLKANRVQMVYKDRYNLEVKAKKEIIISAGAVETPKLLMLSGIGPKTHLQSLDIPLIKDLPVGNNVENHPRSIMFMRFKSRKRRNEAIEFLDAFYDQWVYRKGRLGRKFIDYVGYVSTNGSRVYPDIQFLFEPISNLTSFTKNYKSSISRSLKKQVRKSDWLIAVSIVLLRPKSRGIIRLQSKDYREKPLIIPNYFQDNDDYKVMINGVRKLLDFERTEVFRKLNGEFLRLELSECDSLKFRSNKYCECYTKYLGDTMNHPTSSAKMGKKNDEDAVISSSTLEVHGVKGLRVIDASVMPNIVSSSTSAAVAMIAEKGAELIRMKWDY